MSALVYLQINEGWAVTNRGVLLEFLRQRSQIFQLLNQFCTNTSWNAVLRYVALVEHETILCLN